MGTRQYQSYDEDTERYIKYDFVQKEANRLNLKLAPVFYKGEFQTLDHINSFIGQSKLGEVGEGVVVKNYEYINKFGDQVFTKIVSDAFAEKAKTKKQIYRSESMN